MLIDYRKIQNKSVFKLQFEKRRRGRNTFYINIPGVAFDIETSTKISRDNNNELLSAYSYMYIATFAIHDKCYYCKNWNDVIDFLNDLKSINNLNENKKLIIWIANISFEFQFMRKQLNNHITNIVARSKRNIIMFEYDECIEFRDALAISGGNLAYLAKNYCTTQKMLGDLDYLKMRNSNDIEKLTPKEKQYIINDVVILTEFHTYILNNFKNKIPLTKTSIVRNDIQKEFKKFNYFKQQEYKEIIQTLFPETFENYAFYMLYLFRGGYVHANYTFANQVLKNVTFADEKSAYPYVLLFKYVPISKFNAVKIKLNELQEYLDKYCCIMDITFKNIRAKTTHSIESFNKTIECENYNLDNGRINRAEKMRVCLTELDFKNYENYYSWDYIELNYIEIARRGEIPKFIKRVIIKYFEIKENTPKETPEYMQNKGSLNSIYGCMVTRLLNNDFSFENGDVVEVAAKEYAEQIKGKLLSPFWGVWCTAHARNLLLNMSHKLDNVCYNDTDSVEFLHSIENIIKIKEYNKKVMRENMKKYSNKLLEKLGTFEIEIEKAEKFKTLGAKRYIYTKGNKHHVTIAGLPKTSLIKYCEENNLDIYDVFNDDMNLDIDLSLKNTAIYNDNAHSDIINGVEMYEESSVAIVKIPFKMSISEYYLHLIQTYIEENSKLERRLN